MRAIGEENLSPLMISIISTGALTVNTRGPRSSLEKGEETEGAGLGRRGRLPRGACSNDGAGKCSQNGPFQNRLKLLCRQRLLVSV